MFLDTINVGRFSVFWVARLVVLLQLKINNIKLTATKKESIIVIVNSISDEFWFCLKPKYMSINSKIKRILTFIDVMFVFKDVITR